MYLSGYSPSEELSNIEPAMAQRMVYVIHNIFLFITHNTNNNSQEEEEKEEEEEGEEERNCTDCNEHLFIVGSIGPLLTLFLAV